MYDCIPSQPPSLFPALLLPSTTQHLHAMHNYSSLMAILDGFILPPIDRLKKTVAKCDKVVMKRVSELQKIMEPSEGFRLLREDLKHVTGPCIPYM